MYSQLWTHFWTTLYYEKLYIKFSIKEYEDPAKHQNSETE